MAQLLHRLQIFFLREIAQPAALNLPKFSARGYVRGKGCQISIHKMCTLQSIKSVGLWFTERSGLDNASIAIILTSRAYMAYKLPAICGMSARILLALG